MARQLRIEYQGAFYHVTARGNERKRIYFTKRDYLRLREYIEDAREKYGCLLHVYVFMMNHYHMILETPQANISKVMHFINGSYTNYDGIVKSPSVDFLLTETEKHGFRFPYKSTG